MDKLSTIDINAKVYNETTLPAVKTNFASKLPQKKKSPRRDKSDLGEDFIAPDGGWAWVVCIAAGISNLSTYPAMQQFGFIYRERLQSLGMSNPQITTIVNSQQAISACTGLLNGPMFRRFTFRQVGMAGSLLIFSGIFLSAFCSTFLSYILSFALVLGFGMGIGVSASSLAINTYFKQKRRQASGFSWTITGLGPIFLPHLVTMLVAVYGVQWTVLLIAAVSLHTFVSALIYQPVRYHAPNTLKTFSGSEVNSSTVVNPVDLEPEYLCKFCEIARRKNAGIFSSQYLYMDDDEDKPGFEITDPGTPMLSRANDGWFGSKLSLTSGKKSVRFRKISISKELDGVAKTPEREFLKPNNFNRERDEFVRGNLRTTYGRSESGPYIRCTCAEEKVLLELAKGEPESITLNDSCNVTNGNEEVTFFQKVVAFLDLDLLRDFTFINLVAGLTLINFGELNFSILTPFILADFGFDTTQSTFAISVLGVMDLILRFIVPFLTAKIHWDNRVFFLIGVVGIASGRTVVAFSRSYPVILCAFAWIGMCKGIRTIFWPLIIPGYVPLKRLPAASGLQLLISGLFTLTCGPFVGILRDRFDYSVILHCLNTMTFISAASWSLEAYGRNLYRKKKEQACVQA